jgi:uncharacterized protein (TIGR02217 family)
LSNAVFPNLTSLAWNRAKTPTWSTVVRTSASGKEFRSSLWSYPTWNFTLSYDVLSNREGLTSDFQNIIAFFNHRRGSFDDFLYEDVTDNHVEKGSIGVGDGVMRDFQLIRKLGDWAEPVKNVKGSVTLFFDGEQITDGYDVNEYGLVTFNPAPPVGVSIEATFDFYYRVRFKQDSVEFNQFLYNLYELKKLELKGVK